jgi:hypothetical protein
MRYLLVLGFALLVQPLFAAEAVFESEYLWVIDDDRFGGFSGLEVSDNGENFTSISDRGSIITGQIIRRNGKITGVKADPLLPILDTKSKPVVNYHVDAEGLAIDAQGRLFISFEADHRVWRYDSVGGQATALKTYKDFKTLQNNSGLEPLAIDTDGTLYSLPERSGEVTRPFPIYRFKDGTWDSPFTIPRRDRYLPVGADFGPDGKFYLLERDFVWYAGFSNRIRRFDLTEEGFVNEETLLTAASSSFGNLEGISVWRDDQGRIRLTMIGDDNFSRFQSTKIVEFSLPVESD